MSNIKLSNPAHASYFRTDNAVDAFRLAVTNGQTRIALEMLVDILQALTADLDSEEDLIDPETIKTESKPAPKVVKAKESNEGKASTPAKKQVAQKKTASPVKPASSGKEETEDTE